MSCETIGTGAISLGKVEIATNANGWKPVPVTKFKFIEDSQAFNGLALLNDTSGIRELEYKFIIDGAWRIDIFSPSIVDAHGHVNNIYPSEKIHAIFEKTKFVWNATYAHEVSFACKENAWEPVPMTRVGPHFEIECYVPKAQCARFEFKFIVDGHWYYDLRMPTCRDSNGNVNNYVACQNLQVTDLLGHRTCNEFEQESDLHNSANNPLCSTMSLTAGTQALQPRKNATANVFEPNSLSCITESSVGQAPKQPKLHIEDNINEAGPYKLNDTIGHSKSCLIKNATDTRTGMSVVAKVFSKSSDLGGRMPQVAGILKDCDSCNNITKLADFITTSEHHVFIHKCIEGAVDVEDLMERQPLPEEKARYIFKQLMHAVHFLHERNYCHLDITARNLLMDIHGAVRLIDFKHASSITHQLSTFHGTPGYLSPERAQCREYDGKKTDIWSAGVLLYFLLSAEFPFDTEEREFVTPYDRPPSISNKAMNLIQRMLKRGAVSRPTSGEVLAHEWLN